MKERLDMLLVKRSFAESREKAKAIIMSGIVFVNGQREDKPGSMFADTAPIELRGETLQYVSRGGLKLEKALKEFQISLDDKICLDVGASTGGFTDCMLQNGAKKVYALDVGTNQLAWKLRNDSRVISMEQTNIRYVTPGQFTEAMEFVSVDVAFISLKKVLPAVMGLMEEDARLVCLIKPQFEAGREKVGKKGVVRDPQIHLEVVEEILFFAAGLGFFLNALTYSPIRGPEGNIEYLLYLKKTGACQAAGDSQEADGAVKLDGADRGSLLGREDVSRIYGTVSGVVAAAHASLDPKPE